MAARALLSAIPMLTLPRQTNTAAWLVSFVLRMNKWSRFSLKISISWK